MRHSAAHLMAGAVLKLFPDAKFAIGPAIEDGFYYDFDLPRPLTPEDLEQIERLMAEDQAANIPYEYAVISRAEALELFKDQPYKVELIEGLPEDATISHVPARRLPRPLPRAARGRARARSARSSC